MAGWYLDEGLVVLRAEWRREHPAATVYTIADGAHSQDPDISQHAPDRGGSKPGDDRGEVDAADFMPGNGVDAGDLDDLFNGLVRSRDPRILLLIWGQTIVSSVVDPWKRRTYTGKRHGHVHVSVNDLYSANRADWKWEPPMARTVNQRPISGKLPDLLLGDEDSTLPGWDHLKYRVQPLLNALDGDLPDLDLDGVYGRKTAAKLARVMRDAGDTGTTSNGTKISTPEWRRLYGMSA